MLVLADTIDQIKSSWLDRSQNIDSVRFKYSGQSFTPKGYLSLPLGPSPPEDRFFDFSGELLLDLANKRLVLSESSEVAFDVLSENPVWKPRYTVLAYDHERFYAYSPKEKDFNGEVNGVTISGSSLTLTNDVRGHFCSVEHIPLLVTSNLMPLALIRRPFNLDAKTLELKLEIDVESEHEGHPCYVIRSPASDNGYFSEIWVDKHDSYKVYRFDQYHNDEMTSSNTIQYQESPIGSIPKSWKTEDFNFQNGKAKIFTVTLDSYEINPAVTIEDFQVVPPPGTRVYDDSLPKDAQRYVVPEPGQPPLPVEEAKLQQEASDSALKRNAVLIGILLVLVAGGFLLRRSRRMHESN